MNIGIYVYDQAEVLDFSGPFEVFSTASRWSVACTVQSWPDERPGRWILTGKTLERKLHTGLIPIAQTANHKRLGNRKTA